MVRLGTGGGGGTIYLYIKGGGGGAGVFAWPFLLFISQGRRKALFILQYLRIGCISTNAGRFVDKLGRFVDRCINNRPWLFAERLCI